MFWFAGIKKGFCVCVCVCARVRTLGSSDLRWKFVLLFFHLDFEAKLGFFVCPVILVVVNYNW